MLLLVVQVELVLFEQRVHRGGRELGRERRLLLHVVALQDRPGGAGGRAAMVGAAGCEIRECDDEMQKQARKEGRGYFRKDVYDTIWASRPTSRSTCVKAEKRKSVPCSLSVSWR